MKAALGVKVAFGILALYLSIPLSIVAVQKVAQATTATTLPQIATR